MPDESVPPSSSPRRLPPILRRAWYSMNQAFRHRTSHLGITPDQYSILRWLQEGDARGLTQQTLTDLMASDPNTITSILQRMEKAGLIERRAHESDKRARRVCVLAKGRQAFSVAYEIATGLQREILASIPANRRERFLQDLEAVAEACAGALKK